MEMHKALLVACEPSPFEIEMAVEKLERYKFVWNRFKQEMKRYILISINPLIMFGIKAVCYKPEGRGFET
jgi:hypothetical protein